MDNFQIRPGRIQKQKRLDKKPIKKKTAIRNLDNYMWDLRSYNKLKNDKIRRHLIHIGKIITFNSNPFVSSGDNISFRFFSHMLNKRDQKLYESFTSFHLYLYYFRFLSLIKNKSAGSTLDCTKYHMYKEKYKRKPREKYLKNIFTVEEAIKYFILQ